MLPLIVVLILVFVFFGVGFSIHLLWIIAAVLLILWLIGFARPGSGRWYGR